MAGETQMNGKHGENWKRVGAGAGTGAAASAGASAETVAGGNRSGLATGAADDNAASKSQSRKMIVECLQRPIGNVRDNRRTSSSTWGTGVAAVPKAAENATTRAAAGANATATGMAPTGRNWRKYVGGNRKPHNENVDAENRTKRICAPALPSLRRTSLRRHLRVGLGNT